MVEPTRPARITSTTSHAVLASNGITGNQTCPELYFSGICKRGKLTANGINDTLGQSIISTIPLASIYIGTKHQLFRGYDSPHLDSELGSAAMADTRACADGSESSLCCRFGYQQVSTAPADGRSLLCSPLFTSIAGLVCD
jgi:hypothetical protein